MGVGGAEAKVGLWAEWAWDRTTLALGLEDLRHASP